MERFKEALLKQRYPKMYKFLHVPKVAPNSLLLPIQFGLECGVGWFDLIDKASAIIEKEIDALPLKDQDTYYLEQLKEKYGSIRIYMTYETDIMEKAIEEAEKESLVTCEVCGATGSINGGSWYKVRCLNCP